VIGNKTAQSNLDCIRGNRSPLINLLIDFVALFFLHEYTGRKNQKTRGREDSTIFLIFRTNSRELLPQPGVSPRDAAGGREQPGVSVPVAGTSARQCVTSWRSPAKTLLLSDQRILLHAHMNPAPVS